MLEILRDSRTGKDHPVILSVVVKDGEVLIEEFLDYHFALGVEEFVLIDNGSSDKTIEIASRYPGLILRCVDNYATHIARMKRDAISFANQWALHLDIDERLDWPGRPPGKSLGKLLKYLDQHKYTGVVGLLLDVFPDRNLDETDSGSIYENHNYFSSIGLATLPYNTGRNRTSNGRTISYFGGIRNWLFGGPFTWLTKHPLLRPKEIKSYLDGNCHEIHGARLADFTVVLPHVKFHQNYWAEVQRAVMSGKKQYADTYRALYQKLQENQHVNLTHLLPALRYSAERVYASGLIPASARFLTEMGFAQ
jgi:hypothetical protein